jgi:hypothetical protein
MIIKASKYFLIAFLFIVFVLPIFLWTGILGLLIGNSQFALLKIRDIWWNVIEQFDSEFKI